MGNKKGLWAVFSVLLVCVIVLFSCVVILLSEASENKHADNRNIANGSNVEEQERIIAKIGDHSITYRQLQQKLINKYGRELLNQLLDREAIKQEGKSLAIQIETEQIKNELKRMQQGYDSEEQFYESMEEQLGFSKRELAEDVYYKLMLELIAIRNIEISDELVEDYIREHPDEMDGGLKLHILQIIASTQEGAADIISELHSGTDFELLARDRSMDEMTAEIGGDLGFIGLGDPFVPPQIMEAARLLAIDEISEPIALDDGYAVIKVSERMEPNRQDQQQWRELVRKELALNEAPPLMDVIAQLREKRNAQILEDIFSY